MKKLVFHVVRNPATDEWTWWVTASNGVRMFKSSRWYPSRIKALRSFRAVWGAMVQMRTLKP